MATPLPAHDRPPPESRARPRYLSPAAAASLIVVGAVVGFGTLGVLPHMLADEGFHVSQTESFVGGTYEMLRGTAMLPTYHAILALAEKLIGRHDVVLLRFLNLLGSLLLPLLVWRLVAMHAPRESGLRSVQWFYMPLVFPLCFLVYTDAWALVAMLATQLCALRGRGVLAALAGLAAALLRQDMIVWVGLAWLLIVLGDFGPSPWRDAWRARLRSGLRRGLPLMLVLLAFASFYLWNRGIAVGDRERQQAGFNPTNIAVFLLCAWLVFLPQNLRALPQILPLLKRPLCIALLLAGFALYMGTYANTHEFNSERLRYFLHNEVLYWLTEYPWLRAAAFVPMAWMALSLCVGGAAPLPLRLLYVLAPLAAGLHPLIEQRYYLPALTLFQVWRAPGGRSAESATLALYAAGSAWIAWGIVSGRFFP